MAVGNAQDWVFVAVACESGLDRYMECTRSEFIPFNELPTVRIMEKVFISG